MKKILLILSLISCTIYTKIDIYFIDKIILTTAVERGKHLLNYFFKKNNSDQQEQKKIILKRINDSLTLFGN